MFAGACPPSLSMFPLSVSPNSWSLICLRGPLVREKAAVGMASSPTAPLIPFDSSRRWPYYTLIMPSL
jgi:hypothetical protein